MGAPVVRRRSGGDRARTATSRASTALRNASADEIANVLGHFKSKDGDITVYAPGNLLIITDTGSNIQRMMRILEDVDVGGVGDQIWIEPIHYGIASDIAARLNEVFDLKGAGGAAAGAKPGRQARRASTGSDVHVAKILADDRSNSLVIIGTERAYLRILEFIKRLDVPHSGEGEIHVLPLQHADAVELAKTLNEIVTGAARPRTAGAAEGRASTPLTIFESGVKVSADKATNSIVVTSSLRDFAKLRTVIDRLDQARRQVFIEAVIMDLSIDRENQLGMAFHAARHRERSARPGADAPLRRPQPAPVDRPAEPDGLHAERVRARRPRARPPGQREPPRHGHLDPGVRHPAQRARVARTTRTSSRRRTSWRPTTSRPRSTSAEHPAPDERRRLRRPPRRGRAARAPSAALGGLGALGGFGTAPRQDIGTKIKITPHLNDSDEVRLEVTEEISDVSGQRARARSASIPFSKRTAQTQLVVKDQQTVVIGGLMRNRIARTDTKIPLLGDIPVLGALFRSTSTSVQKSNLILVLTPYIIREQADLRTVFERKMQERQEFLDHYFVFSDDTQYEPPKDYSRTNGLLEDIRQSYAEVEEQRRLDELTQPARDEAPRAGAAARAARRSGGESSTRTPGRGRRGPRRAGANAPAASNRPPRRRSTSTPPARSVEKIEK